MLFIIYESSNIEGPTKVLISCTIGDVRGGKIDVFQVSPTERKLLSRPRCSLMDYIALLTWGHLRILEKRNWTLFLKRGASGFSPVLITST
ncbi:hypothetical protein ILYODFUR_019529 [Ilyodon furcidens]|uniref:Uncharacterized protein n=1 Tax=Ilyodon furcidens TaxID=33524 RepID=A0ABV0SNA6_9TELE